MKTIHGVSWHTNVMDVLASSSLHAHLSMPLSHHNCSIRTNELPPCHFWKMILLPQHVVTPPARTPDSSCTWVVCPCKVNKILDSIQVFACAPIPVLYPPPAHLSWNHNHNTTIMLYSYKIFPYASGKGPIPFGNA